MYKFLFLLSFFLITSLICSCVNDTARSQAETAPARTDKLSLDINEANRLAALPLACTQTIYPNKLGQTLSSADDIGEPHELHPAFYGCFDWHSSVHGHWSMVKLLDKQPDISFADSIRQVLIENITADNIAGEVNYFNTKINYSYERMYGWAWLLKLAQALHEWDDPLAQELGSNLEPLTQIIAQRYITFLPKLYYPVRVGTHTNTAFGLSFAYDYSLSTGHAELQAAIERAARRFYLTDTKCPITWEPSGTDFLSPCFEEIDIMRRVLSKTEFHSWVTAFMPGLLTADFSIEPGIVTDREDGHLVHLDGLNFSRAWVLYGLAEQYDQFQHLIPLANKHVEYSLPSLVGDHYEGGHWLGSFAIYALSTE